MKLNDVEFYGFTRSELEHVRKETGKTGEEDITLSFGQTLADMFECSIATMIMPGDVVAIIKAGE